MYEFILYAYTYHPFIYLKIQNTTVMHKLINAIIRQIVVCLIIHGGIVDIMHIHSDLLYVLVPSS